MRRLAGKTEKTTSNTTILNSCKIAAIKFKCHNFVILYFNSMKNLNFIIASCLLAVTTSCKTVNPTSATTGQNAPYQNLGHNGKIYSAFYQQRAAEYEALCLQAYNIAKFRLDEALAQKSDRQLAIVSDIDETFLDNSYYAVERSKMGKTMIRKHGKNGRQKELLHLLQVRRNSISMQQAKAFRFFTLPIVPNMSVQEL